MGKRDSVGAGRPPHRPKSPSAIVIIVVTSAVAATLAGGAPLHAQMGVEEVTSLRFEGNERYSDRTLSASIVTRATECRSIFLSPFCWIGASFAIDPYLFGPREFERDVARLRVFYYRRGYREAAITPSLDRSNDRVRITFRIDEGRPVVVDSLSVIGLEQLDAPDLLADLPTGVGAPLDQIELDAARDSLSIRLRNAGYAHADVLLDLFIPAEQPYGARVTFDVFAGPRAVFGPISVDGNSKVSDGVIQRMLPFRENSLYRAEQVVEARRNLYGLEIFSSVDVSEQAESLEESVVPMRVSVVEGDAHRFRTGGGWSTADCINAEARWTSRNFMGGGRRFQARARVANLLNSALNTSVCRQAGVGEYGNTNWSLSTEFSQPWLFSPRNSFSANLFWERQSLPDLFVRQSLGVDLGISRNMGIGQNGTIFYQPTVGKLDAADVFFCSSFLVCDFEGIGVLQSANWLAPIGFRASQERGSQGFGLSHGYALSLDFEQAANWTGSDFEYRRVIGEASGFRELTEGWALASRFRGGWLNAGVFKALGGDTRLDIAHPQKRFYSGGATSVRGFAQNQLGPRVLFVDVERLLSPGSDGAPTCTQAEIVDLSCDASSLFDERFISNPTGGSTLLEGNVELRFPLWTEDWQGTAFVDFGQVWSNASPVELEKIEWTPGMGLRYFTPIGPLRLDVAYRFRGGEDHRVLTPGIRPFDEDIDSEADRLPSATDFVRSGELAILTNPILFGDSDEWSLRRFQIHLSIGQAF